VHHVPLRLLLLRLPRLLDGCDAASLTVVGPAGRVATPVATHPGARTADLLQDRAREGPGLIAVRAGEVVVADAPVERRWPAWAACMARESSYCSVLARRVHADGATATTVTLYARAADAFGAVDRAVLEAALAAVDATWAPSSGRLGSQGDGVPGDELARAALDGGGAGR
jgi:hypothetical protein